MRRHVLGMPCFLGLLRISVCRNLDGIARGRLQGSLIVFLSTRNNYSCRS